jgi:hypothetical protein
MAADKVLTDLARRYIQTLPPVKEKQRFSLNLINSFFIRALLNYQKIMFAHH